MSIRGIAGPLLGIVALLAVVSDVSGKGTAYYLSPSGADANTGTTQDHAWKSIDRANHAALQPGDSILFEGGKTFSGSLLINTSGSVEMPINVGSYGDGRATIQAGDSFGIRLLNCQYINVRGLTLRGSGASKEGQTTNHEQALDIYSTATTGQPWQHVYVNDLVVSGFRDGIVLHTPIGKQKVVGYNDVRITNCTVSECVLGGIYCWGGEKDSGAPWHLPLGSSLFTNCYFGDCAVFNIYGDPVGDPIICLPIQILNAKSSLMERCTIHDCGQSGNPHGSQGGVGGFVFLECDQCVAQFNECYHIFTNIKFDGCAFDIDGGCAHCILQYNFSHDNDGSGFQSGPFAGAHVVADNVIRYNISVNDVKKNPQSCGGIMTWGVVERGQIYNNTVYCSATGDVKPAAFMGSGEGCDVRNNIFVVSHDGPISNIGGAYTMQGNCYYRTNGTFNMMLRGKAFTSLGDWQKGTGMEMLNGAPVGFFADPQFRNVGDGPSPLSQTTRPSFTSAYDLLPTSPLRDRAIDLHGLFHLDLGKFDFHGRPLRAGAQHNVGAVD